MPVPAEQIKKLRAPTPKSEVKKRKGPGGMMLDYVDARYHYDTLDTVCGGHNWQTDFQRDPKGALRAGIGILCERYDGDKEGGWVWKWDTGTESTMEPQKGEHSDALKRAGVQWGISRDLYDSKPESSGFSSPSPSPSYPSATGAYAASRAPSISAPEAPHFATSGWRCPTHGSVKVVPAGVSKRTKRAYPAFEVCAETGCEEKAGRGRKPKPVTITPAPEEWVGMGIDEEDEDFAASLSEATAE